MMIALVYLECEIALVNIKDPQVLARFSRTFV